MMLIYLLLTYSGLSLTFKNSHRTYLSSLNIDEDNCIISCDGTVKCEKIEPCEDFQHHDLRLDSNSIIKDMITLGHNGLRHRLSIKLEIGDMLMMEWDDTLCKLANRFHRLCQKYPKEDCRNSSHQGDGKNIYEQQHQSVIQGEKFDIAYNAFFQPLTHSDPDFVELALLTWYLDHQKLKVPKLTPYENREYFELIGDNNFTHMISPQTYQVGCSYAKYYGGISLVCFYYPYMHTHNTTIYLLGMHEEYQCPYLFPMLDEVFHRLCRYEEYVPSTANQHRRRKMLLLLQFSIALVACRFHSAT